MKVGDFLDAVGGYNESESERVKNIAEIVRMSTTILVNIQLSKEDRVTPHELWPFTWDKVDVEEKIEVLSEEEVSRRQNAMEDILNNIMPGNGNSNLES